MGTEQKPEPKQQNQVEMCRDLAGELEDCGHEDITAADLLDCLASVGLRLVPDFDGDASVAYLLHLSDSV